MFSTAGCILVLISDGLTNAQIANRLGISPTTVARHVSNLFDKIGVSSRAAATAYAVRNGLS